MPGYDTELNGPPELPDSWLLDALMDGVILVGADWSVLFVNQAAERVLRIRKEDIVGKRIGIDLPEPPPERMSVYREVMESRTPRVLRDITLQSPDYEAQLFDAEVHPSPSGGLALVFRDVTRSRRAEQAATRLGRILESSWNEIYIFDAESLRFLQVSRGARENLGYTMEELSGLTPLDLKPEYTPEGFARLLAPLRSGAQGMIVFETVHRRKDGSLYPVEVRLQLARTEAPQVFIAIILDITERREAQDRLEAQAVELEMLNEQLRERTVELEGALAARNRFYAQMSHELRTPINAIVGYNDLILAGIYGPLGEKQRTGIERAQRAAHHLLEIVNDVLDISRLEAGKLEVSPEPVQFGALLDDLSVSARPLAERYGATLQVRLEDCPESVETDPRRVRQILLNLISNAVKFGSGRPVELRCRGDGRDRLVVEVVDQGPGIAPEDQQRIFEDFVQLRAGDDAEGTGLGLPIARRLAELLGGSLDVESEPGHGSVFRLTLPLTPPPRLSRPASPARSTP